MLAAGVAAGHLDQHRETLETDLTTLAEEMRRLAASDVLLGFSVDDEVLFDDGELENDEFDKGDEKASMLRNEAGDAVPALAIHVWLFVWPVPLSPARVSIVPEVAADADVAPGLASAGDGATADEALVDDDDDDGDD